MIEHRARKRFGQNFLTDERITRQIVAAIAPETNDNLVEIGPGKGAITGLILERCPRLNVIELDRDLTPILLAQFAKYRGFSIHQADALKFDFSALFENDVPLRVVGNLPYNISTPLIFHLLKFRLIIKDMHFMLQKEVVDRLTAQAGEKHYGRLGIMAQYYCHMEHVIDVPPESFDPAPKVNSAVVRIRPYPQLPVVAENIEVFENLVKTAFGQRRKTLRNSLKPILQGISENIDLDLSRRAETLTIEEYVTLSNSICQLNS